MVATVDKHKENQKNLNKVSFEMFLAICKYLLSHRSNTGVKLPILDGIIQFFPIGSEKTVITPKVRKKTKNIPKFFIFTCINTSSPSETGQK